MKKHVYLNLSLVGQKVIVMRGTFGLGLPPPKQRLWNAHKSSSFK